MDTYSLRAAQKLLVLPGQYLGQGPGRALAQDAWVGPWARPRMCWPGWIAEETRRYLRDRISPEKG